MKQLLFSLVLVTSSAGAEIYRCDSEQGPIYSDKPCGEQAEVITVQDSSSGIATGPSDDTKAYLAQKRDERADARKQAAERSQSSSQSSPVVQYYDDDNYPAYWPGDLYPQRPLRPPPRPNRPAQLPSSPGEGGSILGPPVGGRR